MNRELIEKAAAGSLKKDVPAFRVGDVVTVYVRIVEGDKERLQPFRGTVIRRQGSSVSETFTVRRMVNNEGVERTFPLHSPMLTNVEVVRSGRTRRAKLYYLRGRVGKATRLREAAPERQAGGKDEGPDRPEESAQAEGPAEPEGE
ncbi:unnamed protein product [marine sediment metagenome]|uniref:KOW domain-containing protein n=1 Tax=marine sediment metagenome TaxID=412755 RepID=X1JHK0_9ZZZZ